MTPTAYQAWQRLALSLSTPGLQALRRGLLSNDPQLSQDPSCGFDAVSYALKFGDGIDDWDTLRVAWQRHMQQADGGYGAGDPPSWHWFAWHDMQSREGMFAELLELVEVELLRRAARPLKVSVC